MINLILRSQAKRNDYGDVLNHDRGSRGKRKMWFLNIFTADNFSVILVFSNFNISQYKKISFL